MDAGNEGKLQEALRQASEFGDLGSASSGHGQSGAAGPSSDGSAARAQPSLGSLRSGQTGRDPERTAARIQQAKEARLSKEAAKLEDMFRRVPPPYENRPQVTKRVEEFIQAIENRQDQCYQEAT